MTNTKKEYEKRLTEVEIYFNALILLDKGSCKIVCTDIVGSVSEQNIDNNLSTILKANGFLLLYNLVEATIRNSIAAIFESVQSKNITFKLLTDNMRKLWIKQEVKDITSDSIFKLTKKILEDELILFKTECINISGNIDAQKIRDIAEQFGYQKSKDGRDLVTIKEKRNKLAHGEFTFSEIGRDYTVRELIDLKNSTKTYLNEILANIENYINSEGYKIVR
jgi:hypothetical protein